jgi:hypothetical protein
MPAAALGLYHLIVGDSSRRKLVQNWSKTGPVFRTNSRSALLRQPFAKSVRFNGPNTQGTPRCGVVPQPYSPLAGAIFQDSHFFLFVKVYRFLPFFTGSGFVVVNPLSWMPSSTAGRMSAATLGLYHFFTAFWFLGWLVNGAWLGIGSSKRLNR